MKKSLKALIAVAAACALCLSLVACSGGDNEDSAKSDSGEAGDKQTFTVGFDQAYPPYGFVDDNGNFAGFDLDLAAEVCERNGWELVLEPIDWDAKDALLNQGSIDCIWNGFTMEGREGQYAFSEPYMLNEQVVVAKKGGDISSLEDLAGKSVITQIDSAAWDVLNDEEGQAALGKTFAGGAPGTIGDYNNAFMQLETGMVDAVACDLSIAQYQIAAKPDSYEIVGTLSSEHYAVGFKLGDEDRAQTVTDTLRAMDKDGVVKQLCEKYADYGMSYDNWVLE